MLLEKKTKKWQKISNMKIHKSFKHKKKIENSYCLIYIVILKNFADPGLFKMFLNI